MREEESWLPSMKKQTRSITSEPMYVLMQLLSYSGWCHFKFMRACGQIMLGSSINWPWDSFKYNPTVWKRLYRNHNSNVLQNAPKDKLLVFNFKEGWEPICEFLGENIPNKPFPHANKGSSLLKDAMQNHPIVIRMMRESMFTLGVLTLIGAYGGYKVYQNPTSLNS
ncbi:uncharacterized protein LOC100182496 [Ciona intestinalis]